MYIIADPLPRSEILRVDWDELPEIYAVTIWGQRDSRCSEILQKIIGYLNWLSPAYTNIM